VKKLTSSGQVLITAYAPRGHTRRHDPFPIHGNGLGEWTISNSGSGKYWCAIEWTLKDGSQYYYPSASFTDIESCYAYYLLHTTYTTTDGYTGFFGECYNFIYRPPVMDKVPAAQWLDWLIAH